MTNGGISPLYEQAALREVTGDTIHPGGLELTERAFAACHLHSGAKILDVACGTGASVEWLRQQNSFQVVGVDASMLMLQIGKQRSPDLPLARGKGHSLPFTSRQLEGVLVECGLSLMSELELVLREFHRVLLSSGYLIASDLYLRNPEEAGLLRSLPAGCCLQGAKSQYELCEILLKHGFEIIIWEDHSESLKLLSTQLILAHGSMQEFWGKTTPRYIDLFDLQLAIARARPGYYLLVARKIEVD